MDDQILDSNIRAELPEEVLNPEPPKPWYKDWRFIVGAGLLAVLVLAGIGYLLLSKTSGPKPVSNQVGLVITGPDKISSGSEAQYHIKYHNGEKGDLTNVHIDLIYPSNFQFKSSSPSSKIASGQSFDLPIVKEGKDGELVIRGILKGATGEDKPLLAKLHYSLTTFNSTFEVDQTFHTIIQAPNLTFDITGPAEVPIGQDTNFTLNYSNVSGQDYDNIVLTVEYPESFKYAASSVAPSKNNNYWTVGKLASGGSGHINISGSFQGSDAEDQLISGVMGQIISGNLAAQLVSTATFKLKKAPLSIEQESNPGDHVNIGDSIQVTLNYQNESSVGLTNLIITDTFASNLIDTSKLSISDAVITGSTITWKAATNKSLGLLSPGQKGQLSFTLPLRQSLPATLKNQIIKNSVTIASAEVTQPIRAQDLEVKLSSKLNFDIVGDFVSGAQPMQVGKESVFAVTFLLSNTSNDLNSTEVVASLPLPPSSWTNVVIPDSEKSRLHYDESSGLIRWDIGDMPAFTGKLAPAYTVTFQLSVVPQASDQGQIMRLLSDIQATATDSFTNQKLSSQEINEYTTSDLDDQFQSTFSTVQ